MARRQEQGTEVQNSILAEGGEATFIQCDVADVESVERAVEQAAGTYDSIDILFNNAGHGSGGDFPESSTEEWNNVINVNLNGTFYVSWLKMLNVQNTPFSVHNPLRSGRGPK